MILNVFNCVYVYYCVKCKFLYLEKCVLFLCEFDVYDLNGDKVIVVEEFMSVIKDFIIMDCKIFFEVFDKNGKIFM